MRRPRHASRRHALRPHGWAASALRLWLADEAGFSSERFAEELQAGLRAIDFVEVTLEDRITFIDCLVQRHAQRAIACGRFDLVAEYHRIADQEIAALTNAWRS